MLIVDDNEINRKVLRRILDADYEVMEAANGVQALELLKDEQNDFLAVLLDVIMPDMNGFEVLKVIRNNPQLEGIPVIIQTEKATDTFEVNALKAGATDFVTKPYKSETIKTRLANCINTRIMLREISYLDSDEVTGLMSINSFYYESERWIKQNPHENFDVVAIDMVRFSEINDSKGVDEANEILKKATEHLLAHQKLEKFYVSRVYADRFVLLVRRREGYLDLIMQKTGEITKQFANSASVHFRVGIYEITDRTIQLSTAVARAFSATNLIKDTYENKFAFYDKELHDKILLEEQLNEEMTAALANHEFQIYYQPKYNLYTNQIAGAEALVRWIHPTRGVISPGIFIPIFEKNHFIVQLDQYVWRQTAEQIAKWYQDGVKIVPVSVNISRIDLESIDVVTVLEQMIKEYQIAPELLHLEITESAYMNDTDKMVDAVTKLQNSGFIIEMDDFGRGYSSLNMLATLPINVIKLDMQFIQALENSVKAKTIIEYTIGLAKWMNLSIIAEGVETEEQLTLLRQLECNFVQGYIFAKPMPSELFRELLVSNANQRKEDEAERTGIKVLPSEQSLSMMIVDDQELNRAVIRSFFEGAYTIIEACDGKAAWNYMQEDHKIDIVLIDLYMPEMDGFELLEKIKKDKKLRKLPIIAVSSANDKPTIHKVMSLGADEFISKPFTSETINQKVRNLLRLYHLIDELSVDELKQFLVNPILLSICEDITLIRVKDKRICTVSENKIKLMEKSISNVIDLGQLNLSIDKMTEENSLIDTKKLGGYLIRLEKHTVGKEPYIICYRIKIDEEN